MKSKTIISIAVLVIIAIPFVLVVGGFYKNQDNMFGKLSAKYFDHNEIDVQVENELDIHKVRIENALDGQVLYQKGKRIGSIQRIQGDIAFKVFYDNVCIGQSGISTSNWFHTHDFGFTVNKSNEVINFEFSAEGLDEESLYFKVFELTSEGKIQSEIFYDKSGKTGQVNKFRYDESGNLLTDEVYQGDDLETVNFYSNKGEFSKTLNKTKHKIIKASNVFVAQNELKESYVALLKPEFGGEVLAWDLKGNPIKEFSVLSDIQFLDNSASE